VKLAVSFFERNQLPKALEVSREAGGLAFLIDGLEKSNPPALL
jgi:hypothetical protein